MGLFGVLLFWISIVGYVAWVALVILEAAFIAIFGAAVAWTVGRRGRLVSVLAPVVLWVAVEFLRCNVPLGGFTWGQLAQSQHDLGWMLRAASLGGGWLVSAVLLLANSLLADAVVSIRGKRSVAAGAAVGLAALVLIAPVLVPVPGATGDPVRVAIVQGNVPRDFEGDRFEKELAIVHSHRVLTEGLAPEDVDLVVWPESSVGVDMEKIPIVADEVEAAARAVGKPMIVGGNLDRGSNNYLVMAFLVDERGRVADRYQKTHLVPFGEYVPVRDLLDWIPQLDQVPRDALPGQEGKVFEVAGGTVAPVISFEGDFGSLVRNRIDAGGRMLVVATNTSTWGHSHASAQHVAFSQVRAAENRVWVTHAALSGISAFIEPDGSIVETTELYAPTTAIRSLRFVDEVSFYARTGDWFPWLGVVASLGLLASAVLSRGGEVPSDDA